MKSEIEDLIQKIEAENPKKIYIDKSGVYMKIAVVTNNYFEDIEKFSKIYSNFLIDNQFYVDLEVKGSEDEISDNYSELKFEDINNQEDEKMSEGLDKEINCLKDEISDLKEEIADLKSEDNLRCSFCGKGVDKIRKLIDGDGAYICGECVEYCFFNILKGEIKVEVE